MWRLFVPPVKIAWVVIGILLVVEGDRLAIAIGAVFLALWLIYAVRVYQTRP